MIADCRNENDFATMLNKSRDRLQLLLKHSTHCPTSRTAMAEFRRLATTNGDADLSVVLVIETRPLSTWIAERIGVDHQSPQVILLRDGEAVWNASHHEIDLDSMKVAISEASK